MLLNIYILVVLITGGIIGEDTAELFLPSDGTSCTLPLLPQVRRDHTVDNHIVCGGIIQGTDDSCIQWSTDTGTWEELLTLDVGRYAHVSWTPASGTGTYLIGGGKGLGIDTEMTTTLITHEGGQETGFPLKYATV